MNTLTKFQPFSYTAFCNPKNWLLKAGSIVAAKRHVPGTSVLKHCSEAPPPLRHRKMSRIPEVAGVANPPVNLCMQLVSSKKRKIGMLKFDSKHAK